ncbi:hypothetical protein ABZ085_12500, partial [Streptomyces albidoflavus]
GLLGAVHERLGVLVRVEPALVVAAHLVGGPGVQPQGKKPMRAADWARGVRIAPGESLGAADVR